ncbi:AtpZ/AtpI family protein [Clostridiaceae bacterium HSG29]|nr:AtpZ/AtpI family protein [Clostridiaceae bacterium HSG29]
MSKLKFKDYENLTLISQIALIMIIPIFAGLFFGKWLDEKLQTGNIFLLVMIILGVIIAFLNLFKYTMKGIKNKNDEDE